MTVHDLQEQLAYSFSKEGKLDYIYTKYFAAQGIKKIIRENGNWKKQHNGIDTEIELCDGEHITIQEKWRTREYTGDILIEYCSVCKDGVEIKAGWIDDIHATYLAVAYGPSQVMKIYPVAQLKRAWQANKEAWIKQYKLAPARNNGYVTLNVAIPEAILKEAMWQTTSMDYSIPTDKL